MEHDKLAKSRGICDQSWNFTNFAPELYQICILFVTTKKLVNDLEILHFLRFSAKSGRETVMEYQEMVMEK